jgi:3-hydroxy-9,10-secoandrosta-1,3,5(10)-triene-9,17-dione monooxygenase
MPAPSRDQLIARAAALAPILRRRAAETEQLRRIPDQTIADLHEAGLWRILRPEQYGGYLTDFGVIHEVTVELGRGCASTAWVYINIVSHNWMLPMWPAGAMETVWGEHPNALIGSTLVIPTGRLDPVEGGYRFSGRWPYASGVDASDWIMLGALLQSPEGKAAPRFVTVRVADIEIIDTWHVSGLAGTGSKDVACEGLFVPSHMVLDPALSREGHTPAVMSIPGDAYRLPLFPFIPHLVVSPMLGIARGAYEDFLEKMRSQVSIYNRSRIADHITVQMKIAEAGVLIDAASLLVRDNIREAHVLVAAGKRPALLDRARWRRDATYAAGNCVKAVDHLYGVSGATANYLDNEMQRRFRDIHAAAAQIHLSWDINAPEFGRVAVGLPPANPIL